MKSHNKGYRRFWLILITIVSLSSLFFYFSLKDEHSPTAEQHQIQDHKSQASKQTSEKDSKQSGVLELPKEKWHLEFNPVDNATIYKRIGAPRSTNKALCISGTRFLHFIDQKVVDYFQKNIIEPNHPDIFIYGSYHVEPGMDFQRLLDLYGDYIVGFYLFPWLPSHYTLTDYQKQLFAPGFKFNDVPNMHGIYNCYNILLHPYSTMYRIKPYDVVMRARPDVQYYTPLDLNKYILKPYTENNEFALYIPPPNVSWNPGDPVAQREQDGVCVWFGSVLGINDQIAIGPEENIGVYASLFYRTMDKEHGGGMIEAYFYHHLAERLNMKVLKLSYKYQVYRG